MKGGSISILGEFNLSKRAGGLILLNVFLAVVLAGRLGAVTVGRWPQALADVIAQMRPQIRAVA
jgi:hypothetical protein